MSFEFCLLSSNFSCEGGRDSDDPLGRPLRVGEKHHMRTGSSALLRSSLLAAASSAALLAGEPVSAQTQGLTETEDFAIIGNHLITPGTPTGQTGSAIANSPDLLSPREEINGIGQQIALNQSSATGASLGLCTGTLINPRTVITAAHCVYGKPAHAYGSNTGTSGGTFGAWADAYGATNGTPLSYGFESLNRGCADANYVIVSCPRCRRCRRRPWRSSAGP